jgi:hypothetical protein
VRCSWGVTQMRQITHGLYVRASKGLKLRDRKTQLLARKVRSVLTWLEPSDFPTVRAWAELEILCDQVYAVLRAGSVVNAASGEGKRLLHDYRQLRLAQLAYSRELGMTPAARKTLSASGTKGMDLAAAFANAEDAETVEASAKELSGGG